MEDFSSIFKNSVAVIWDLDKTLISKNVSEGIGEKILIDQLMKLRLNNFVYGIRKYKELKSKERNGCEIEGLKNFFEIIGDRKLMKKNKYYKYARRVVENLEIPGARNVINKMKNDYDLEMLLATTSDELSAKAASEYFGMNKYAANPIIFGNEYVKDISLKMYDSDTKFETVKYMIEDEGISLKDCIVIGDSEKDHKLMKNSEFSFGSPLSDNKTKNLVDYWINDYREFMKYF
ncbi:MAG: HAD family hydrolase [Candidatus Aenigmarchaeota archaeon]|nr:HAD family hydrolase [Candidatus Aenigmarchaeota archaeon]